MATIFVLIVLAIFSLLYFFYFHKSKRRGEFEKESDYDVIIIGGGIAGLSLGT
jgi:hypothetical protein